MAAFRKLVLSTVVLAVCGGVATAGALSQPRQFRIANGREPRLTAVSAPVAADGSMVAYTLTLGAASPARLVLSVRGAERVVVREPRGRLLYQGVAASPLWLGQLAANRHRTLLVDLQAAGAGPLDVRWTAASV